MKLYAIPVILSSKSGVNPGLKGRTAEPLEALQSFLGWDVAQL